MLIRLADQRKLGIVFYTAPLNADFLDTIDTQESTHQRCLGLLRDYMANITRNHPNVVYRDLLRYAPISDLRSKGYVDIGHVSKAASQQLLEGLEPDISNAIRWSAGQHREP